MTDPLRSFPSGVRAVLFDCDGTLIDSEPLHATAISTVLARHGVRVSAAEIMRRFTGCDNRTLLDVLGSDLGVAWPPDLDEQFDVACEALLRAESKPMEGAQAALDASRAHRIPVAIASNSGLPLVRAMLLSSGLDAYFGDRLATRDRVAAPKPAADCYLLAARYCSASPSACVAVEDSPAGVRAARAAGIPTLGYRSQGSHVPIEALRDAGAAAIITELHDVARLIEGRPLLTAH